MSWRAAGLLTFAIIAAVVGITSTVVGHSMVEEINRALPPEDRVSPVGWYPGKLPHVVALYRRTHPAGRRHLQLLALLGVGAVGVVLAAVSILLPG
jgi:hypothetical protein